MEDKVDNIIGCNYYLENRMISTKEQEREALRQIKEIIDGLGENSYVATAFDGCFEIAEENIDSDLAISMKDKYEHTSKKLADCERDLNATTDRLVKVSDANEAIKRKMAELVKAVPDKNILNYIINILQLHLNSNEKTKDVCAEDIVTYAEDPSSEEFKTSVTMHRKALADIEFLNGVIRSVSGLKMKMEEIEESK